MGLLALGNVYGEELHAFEPFVAEGERDTEKDWHRLARRGPRPSSRAGGRPRRDHVRLCCTPDRVVAAHHAAHADGDHRAPRRGHADIGDLDRPSERGERNPKDQKRLSHDRCHAKYRMARRLPRPGPEGARATGFKTDGSPSSFPYATVVPGLYAVSDVRARSVKRVASGVGDGSVVVQAIHGFLHSEP